MSSNVGFRVFTKIKRVPPDVVAAYREFEVPHVGDAMNKFGVMDPGIRPIYQPMPRLVGPAVTVKAFPGDHLMVRKGMELCQPGDVLVIDGRGDVKKAVWGGMVTEMMCRRKVAGVVIDGASRDRGHIQRLSFPVFARAVTPTAPTLVGPGEVNTPVCCGGVVVNPGDLILGDSEGVVVVPRDDAAALVAKVRAVMEKEQGWMEGIVRGELLRIDWVNAFLDEQGCTTE